MPKAVLEFSEDEVFDGELQVALDGWKYKYVINEIFNKFIRQKVKYDEKTTEEEHKLLEELRSFIVKEFEDRNLPLED